MDVDRLREPRRCSRGGIVRLARIVHGDLYAGPLRRDLLCDRLTFDELGWQDLVDYVDHPPTGTALRDAFDQERERESGGWKIADHLAAELLYELRKLNWRYGAVHFEGGSNIPYPEQITRPGVEVPQEYDGPSWEEATVDDLVKPEVRALLRGE